MKKRFNPELLRQLRNQIPIATLIDDVLEIPNKVQDGYFRFLCPLCSEFNTATNPSTNLARCFSCKHNFNPIDIVMITQKISFTETIGFLKPLLPQNRKKTIDRIEGLTHALETKLCGKRKVK